MTRMPAKRTAACLANSKCARQRRSSPIPNPPEWFAEGPRSSVARTIPCSTSSERSCSPPSDCMKQSLNTKCPTESKGSRKNGKFTNNARTSLACKVSSGRRLDSRASDGSRTEGTVTPGLLKNSAARSSTISKLCAGSNPADKPTQLQTLPTPTSSQKRPELRVVISTGTTSVSEPRTYRRIVLPPTSPLQGSQASDHAVSDDKTPMQSVISLRHPEDISKFAQHYHKLPAQEQKKYHKTKELRQAIWPEATRPSDSALELALYSMRPQEQHEKYPFAFSALGIPYAEYQHLCPGDDSRSGNINIVPSVENKRRERCKPLSEIKVKEQSERIPARLSPDFWIQDQSSFDQEVRLRAENEGYRKENETLKAEIEKLKERSQLMSRHLITLERARNKSLEQSAALASSCETILAHQSGQSNGFMPSSGLDMGKGTTFVVRIHNMSSPPATQTAEPTQA